MGLLLAYGPRRRHPGEVMAVLMMAYSLTRWPIEALRGDESPVFAGMTWSQKMKSGSFSNATPLTAANSYGYVNGNNLRFDSCNMNGPLVSDVPTAYTHFTNSCIKCRLSAVQ